MNIWFLAQILFITMFLFILSWQILIGYILRQTIRSSKIKPSFVWILIIIGNIVLILSAIAFVLMVKIEI